MHPPPVVTLRGERWVRGKTLEGRSSVGNHWIVGEGVLNQKGFQSSSHSELSREVSSGERKIPPWGPPDHFGVEHMSMCRQAGQAPQVLVVWKDYRSSVSCRGKKRGKKRAETLVGRVCGLLLQTGLSEPTEGGLWAGHQMKAVKP